MPPRKPRIRDHEIVFRMAPDDEFVASLMRPVTEPGQFASWIAPPRTGIDNKPGDFEYVRLAG